MGSRRSTIIRSAAAIGVASAAVTVLVAGAAGAGDAGCRPVAGTLDELETRTGDIDMLVAGAFDTASGRFSDLLTIVGGTGEWEGATGQVHLFGTFDFATGTGQSDDRGETCTASN